MDYDTYIDLVAEYLDVNSLNTDEIKIIEGCFQNNRNIEIAADLIKIYWEKNDSEDYNAFGDYD